MRSDLQFVQITPENWRQYARLAVAETQRGHVAENTLILARAYVYRDGANQVWGIQVRGQPIGLLLEREDKANGRLFCVLDQLMIDQQFQGKGYGSAMRLWLEQVRGQRLHDTVILCYKRDSAENRRFYERLGFTPNGQEDGDEIVMEGKLHWP